MLKRDFAGVIKLRVLRWEIRIRPNIITRILIRGRSEPEKVEVRS